jgi:hypothetical protein
MKSLLSKMGMTASALLLLLVVAGPLVLFLVLKLNPAHQTCESNAYDWYACAESRAFLLITIGATISGAALFGAIGAIFSALWRASATWDSSALVAGTCVGALMATVLTLVFGGGFVGGMLFPRYDSDQIGWFGVIYRPSEYAKLLVWAFAAGFFERLVPKFLDKLADRLRLGFE